MLGLKAALSNVLLNMSTKKVASKPRMEHRLIYGNITLVLFSKICEKSLSSPLTFQPKMKMKNCDVENLKAYVVGTWMLLLLIPSFIRFMKINFKKLT